MLHYILARLRVIHTYITGSSVRALYLKDSSTSATPPTLHRPIVYIDHISLPVALRYLWYLCTQHLGNINIIKSATRNLLQFCLKFFGLSHFCLLSSAIIPLLSAMTKALQICRRSSHFRWPILGTHPTSICDGHNP